MSTDQRTHQVELAARNNAIWCDTISEAHGSAGTFQRTFWINSGISPRFYPNIVTLAPADDEHRAAIRALADSKTESGWGVKDSFARIDLAPLGFEPLFDASWIWLAPERMQAPEQNDLAWSIVRSPDELAAWEAAWNGTPAGLPVDYEVLFPTQLLARDDIAFITIRQDDQVIAGAIANNTKDVVGISNLFLPEVKKSFCLAQCLYAALRLFPGLPLVGYESGGDLATMLAAGFETIGPLRVWLRATA
jgi:hypothetical protein